MALVAGLGIGALVLMVLVILILLGSMSDEEWDDSPAIVDNGAVQQPQVANPAGTQDEFNRDVSLINQSGDTIMYLYWSNVNMDNWGDDRLGANVLPDGQTWFVTVDDGTGACQFDFRAVTANGNEIERRNVNVCGVWEIYLN